MGAKKPYRKPALQTYGDIRALTASQCTDKRLGLSDGFTLLQQPITYNCS